ncbi:MAG: nitroreductase family protein [Candidatus Bilamarchaeaceae archaeon]
MDFYSVVKQRRSVRAFLEQDIEKEKLDRVIGAFMLAPSAGNLQAYKVYIVKNPALKQELAEAALGQECISGAPLVLVFCADKKRSAMKYSERGFELYSVQDATIAAAYAQLAAAAEGLGSVWVGAFDPLEVSRLINADPYVVPVAIIPIGYPAEHPFMRERRSVKEIVKEIK